jgi:hypothetical protein
MLSLYSTRLVLNVTVKRKDRTPEQTSTRSSESVRFSISLWSEGGERIKILKHIFLSTSLLFVAA